MSVYLEPVAPQEEIEEPALTIVEGAPEEPPAPETIIQEPTTQEEEGPAAPVEEATAPAPKRRGRPRKDPAAKANAVAHKQSSQSEAPQPLTHEISDVDEPIGRDDMETLLLDYLIKRTQTQQDARRSMWAQLAGLR